MMMHCRIIGVFWGPYTPSTSTKIYLLAWGVVTHQGKMTAHGAGRKTLWAALGGHFFRRRLLSAIVVMVVDPCCQIISIPT
jgi:hypothetical protein